MKPPSLANVLHRLSMAALYYTSALLGFLDKKLQRPTGAGCRSRCVSTTLVGGPAALCLIGASLIAVECHAVIIFEKGSDQPLRGYLVEANDVRVVIQVPTARGGLRERILPRTSIDEMIVTVRPERLSELTPTDPRAYRDYADDLNEKRQDPDARRTALRLYLIAAYLDPDALGRGCLLSIVDLATSDAERRKYQAMVYLLDPSHDASVLRDAPPRRAETPDVSPSEIAVLQRGLRALRSGPKQAARNFAKQAEFRAALSKFPQVLTVEQYVAAAEDTSPEPSDKLLRQIVALELKLVGREPVVVRPKTSSDSWSKIQLDSVRPVTELSLEAVSSFDPRECLFKDGEWVAPQ